MERLALAIVETRVAERHLRLIHLFVHIYLIEYFGPNLLGPE